MTVFSIYKITCTVDGKIYVSWTSKAIEQTWIDHKHKCSGKKSKLHNHMMLHGADKFNIELIETVATRDKVNDRVSHHVRELDTFANGLNGQVFGRSKAESSRDYYLANIDKIKAKKRAYYDSIQKVQESREPKAAQPPLKH